jgi:DNA invertase Pin-like site-specific DNA recombinase
MEQKGVIGYIRVSTDEQATEGVSIEAQRERIEAYCAMQGLPLLAVVVDAGVSGGKPLASRPGGAEVMAALRSRRVGGVVVLKLDRLFRDTVDALTTTKAWDQRGKALHVVDMGGQPVDTSSPMGRFFMTMLAGVAELERGMIGQRTSVAMAELRRQGRYTGGKAPYGKRLEGGRLVDVPEEQAVLAAVAKLRRAGLSYRAIARELEARGMVSRRGTRFTPNAIMRMVRRAA